MHYSLLNLNPFFPVGWHISQIFTKPSGNVASGCLSHFKEFGANLRNVSTDRKRELHSTDPLKIIRRIQKLWCQTSKNILLQFKG